MSEITFVSFHLYFGYFPLFIPIGTRISKHFEMVNSSDLVDSVIQYFSQAYQLVRCIIQNAINIRS